MKSYDICFELRHSVLTCRISSGYKSVSSQIVISYNVPDHTGQCPGLF